MKLLDLTCSTPAENLACDEALLDTAEAGESGEVLRFWEAREHFVVVGYSNKVATEVNIPACEAKRIQIFRRCSGGGTVLQGPGCLNYSLVLRMTDDGPLRTIGAANKFIMEANRAAIEALALKSEIKVSGHTDLTIDGRKFSGNSQRRRKQFLLFHGTFLLNFDLALISDSLQMPSKQPDYREGRGHEDFLLNLNVCADSIKDAMRVAWCTERSETQLSSVQIPGPVLAKYKSREWNFKF